MMDCITKYTLEDRPAATQDPWSCPTAMRQLGETSWPRDDGLPWTGQLAMDLVPDGSEPCSGAGLGPRSGPGLTLIRTASWSGLRAGRLCASSGCRVALLHQV